MVEITIDTQRDSKEELRNTIRYLQSLVGDVSSGTIMESEPTTGVFSMFGSEDSSEQVAPMNMFDDNKTSYNDENASTIFSDNEFSSDADAPSDYTPGNADDDSEDPIIEIVEY